MVLSETEIRQMMPHAGDRLTPHLLYMNAALEEGRVDTPQRATSMLAQLSVESGEFRYMHEIADGWAYDVSVNPQLAAQLGNIEPGDGPKYRGGGPMQITGRSNYLACGTALGLDLINHPELIQTPENGTRSAVWYWNSRELSLFADHDWFRAITYRINGGYNGWAERLEYWERNRGIMGLPHVDWEHETDHIRQFQRDHGLSADGQIGPNTLRAMRN